VCVCLTPAISFSIILVVWSWLSPFGCHTETLATSRSIGLSNGGVGGDRGITGVGGGGGAGGDEGEEDGDGFVGNNGPGRGVKEGVSSEETGVCRESRGAGDSGVGERGVGRDRGGGLWGRGGGTEERGEGGLEMEGEGGLETGG